MLSACQSPKIEIAALENGSCILKHLCCPHSLRARFEIVLANTQVRSRNIACKHVLCKICFISIIHVLLTYGLDYCWHFLKVFLMLSCM